MSGTAFDRSDAAALVELASLTELDLTNLGLPSPWKLIQTFTTAVGMQGYVALGQLPSQPSVNVALLAVGMSWSVLVENSVTSEHLLSFPPGGLVDDDAAMTDLGYTGFYETVRKVMWSSVLFAKQTVRQFTSAMPMVVVGLGPGAPLAQMAALDFRPGHSWQQQASPATGMTSYAFSCVPIGNKQYVSSFNTLVPAGYTINLQTTSGVTVDFYPTGAPPTYALAGKFHGGDAKIATPDDPWVERDAPYYQQTLASSPGARQRASKARPARSARSDAYARARGALAPPADTRAASASYSPVLAYVMSRLSLAEYQRFQHPDLPPDLPPSYTPAGDVVAGGVQWGSIYWNNDRVVVAFRGLETWQELVTTWGTNAVVQPSWLSTGGKILASYDAIYGALRNDLQTKLRNLNMGGKPLVLTGHDVGGALAAIAAYDMTLNAVSGAPVPNAIYAFGAPPVGDRTFLGGYDTTVGAMSFPIVRPDDVIPQLDLLTVLPLNNPTSLAGGVLNSLNGSTFHALTVYAELLNPTAGVVDARREVPESASRFIDEAIEQFELRKVDVHTCRLDTADTDGRLVFSWATNGSFTAPWHDARDRASHVLEDVVVSPGHELLVTAPNDREVRLFVKRLTLTPGARVRIETTARLHIGDLQVLRAANDARETAIPRIDVVGTPGRNGVAGVAGGDGVNGGYGESGGQGGHGGQGQGGSTGGDAPSAQFSIDTLDGVLVVHVEGGRGGRGGNGGAGGHGGDGGALGRGRVGPGGYGGAGGSGGAGGGGGAGSAVTIDVRHFTPGSHIVAETPQAPAGAPGAGAPGGAGGRGMPAGVPGPAGGVGTPGAPGRSGIVSVRQV